MAPTYGMLPSGAGAVPAETSPCPGTLSELEWQQLLKPIEDGKCTAFLGAGVDQGSLPLGRDLAQRWAKEFGYPLADSGDLQRVSQYLSLLTANRGLPKQQMYDLVREAKPPDFTDPTSPLGVLADLPIPIYLTTNYDDFMLRALRTRKRDAKVEVCGWWKPRVENFAIVYNEPDFSSPSAAGNVQVTGFARSRFKSRNFVPTAASPVVYHLHGHYELLESMVLTEDDYLDFLVNMSRDQNLIPPVIQQALTGCALLFMGYSLADYDFKVLFRSLIYPLARSHRITVSIQLPQSQESEALEYLNRYYKDMAIAVYWGKAESFAKELSERWAKRQSGVQPTHVP